MNSRTIVEIRLLILAQGLSARYILLFGWIRFVPVYILGL
jgi:hypothetical protein